MVDVNTKEITRFRGDTYPIVAIIKESGVPIDLSTAVSKLTIAFTDPDSPVTIIGTNVDGSVGKVEFAISTEIAANAGKFFYDIQVDNGGYKTTYVKSIIEFEKDVTQS